MVKQKRELKFSSASLFFAAAALVFGSVYAIQLGNRSDAAGNNLASVSASSSSVTKIPASGLQREFLTTWDVSYVNFHLETIFSMNYEYGLIYGSNSNGYEHIFVKKNSSGVETFRSAFSVFGTILDATYDSVKGQIVAIVDNAGTQSICAYNAATLYLQQKVDLNGKNYKGIDYHSSTIARYEAVTSDDKGVMLDENFAEITARGTADFSNITRFQSISFARGTYFVGGSTNWSDMVEAGEITAAQKTQYEKKFTEKTGVIYTFLRNGTYKGAYTVNPDGLTGDYEFLGIDFVANNGGEARIFYKTSTYNYAVYKITERSINEDFNTAYFFDFDLNGGTGDKIAMIKSISAGCINRYGVETPEPTREGYTFLGWSKDKNDTRTTSWKTEPVFADGFATTPTLVENVEVLYAIWAKNATPTPSGDDTKPADDSDKKDGSDQKGDSDSGTTPETVKPSNNKKNPKNPNTGDDISPISLIGAVTCAGMALLVSVLKRRR